MKQSEKKKKHFRFSDEFYNQFLNSVSLILLSNQLWNLSLMFGVLFCFSNVNLEKGRRVTSVPFFKT